MADDETAALIAEARKMIAGTTFFQMYPRREAMIARLADALERAQGIIDGVRTLCHTECGYESCNYDHDKDSVPIEFIEEILSAQVKPDGE